MLALSLVASAASSQVIITGLSVNVAGNNAVTVNNTGSLVFAGGVGTAGTYPFQNGWGYVSGTARWTDTNNNDAIRIDSANVTVPVSNRISNNNGALIGSAQLSGSTVLGAALRASNGVGTSAFTSTLATGSRTFQVSGTVTIAVAAPDRIMLTGVNLDVDGSDAVTVNTNGTLQLFGSVGGAGTFPFINGWGYASGDAEWRDTNNATVARINSAAGVQVPVANRIVNGNGPSPLNGSVRLSGNTTLGAALRGAFGVGTGFSYSSIIASGGGLTFGVSGTVNIAAVGPPMADVSITKTDGSGTETPGTPVTYTIVVSNAGPASATGVGVADTFPAALSGCAWTSAAAGGATGNTNGSGNISQTLTMPSGSSVTYTATCNIAASATGTLANTATATAPMSVVDPNGANNSATDTDTLVPSADLSITKTDGVTTATPGQQVTYTIVASNVGPSNASGVSVADTFPAALSCSVTSVAAGGATGNTAGPAVGNIGDTLSMPASSSVTYTAVCDIGSGATGSLANTATISSAVSDPDAGNNSATDTDTLVASADLSITKTDGVTTATPGTQVTYTIVASNAGPSDASGVSVADTFPAALTCNVTSVAAGGATGSTAGPAAGNIGDTLSMPASSSVTYTAVCDIDSGATGSLVNTASISSTVGDPATGNNSATDTDTLVASADLAISKTTASQVVGIGGLVDYVVAVDNAGPSDATGVVITDVLPTGLDPVSTSGCAEDPNGFPTCSVGTIVAGSSAQVTFTVRVNFQAVGQPVVNTASVASAVTDPDATNDTASAGTINAANIPTLSQWSLGLLAVLMAGVALVMVRRPGIG